MNPNRYQARKMYAEEIANRILADYGNDPEAYEDRILSICDGRKWLANMVERECTNRITPPKRRKTA